MSILGIGMPDSGAMCLSPLGRAHTMNINWANVAVWMVAPCAPEMPDGSADILWLIVWMNGIPRPFWFGASEGSIREVTGGFSL